MYQQLCKLSKLCHLYNKISGQASVPHARMRMGLSALNAQKGKYNFINDNTCICVIWELKILITTLSFARHWLPYGLHICREYSRYWEIFLTIMFILDSPIFARVTLIVTKWLKPPTAVCKFAVVWCSGKIYCTLTAVRHKTKVCWPLS